jgi:hypothetical protein
MLRTSQPVAAGQACETEFPNEPNISAIRQKSNRFPLAGRTQARTQIPEIHCPSAARCLTRSPAEIENFTNEPNIQSQPTEIKSVPASKANPTSDPNPVSPSSRRALRALRALPNA